SGSTVVSDKPVAVIAGHEDAFTQASDVGTLHVEARDYMVEQMLPVDYWDSTGYISIPFIDSKNAPGGDGDNLAFYYGKPQGAPANYSKGATVTLLPNDQKYSISPFPSSVPIKTGTTIATSASCDKGVKMHVVQYDQRMQGGAPYPAPSQMTLIPKSRWKTSFLWYAPSTDVPQVQYQSNYINLICDKDDYNNGALQLSQDNGAFTAIKAAGTVSGIKQIPGYPDLIGLTIKLASPHTYYAQSTTGKAFMVYTYGFRALDPQQELGTFNGDDQFFSYSAPAGFAAMPGDTNTLSATVSTQCAKWDICATVSGITNPSIRSMILLRDPDEDLVDKPNSSQGYISFNTAFDPKVDSNRKGEIVFTSGGNTECIRILVQNPLLPAYAAVLIIDDGGNYIVKELTYTGSPLADTIKGADFDLTKSPWHLIGIDAGYHNDTILYPVTGVGDSHCATTYYHVSGDSASGAIPMVVTGIKLGGTDGSYTLTSDPVTFPLTLRPKSPSHPADTLKVTTCFSAKDITSHVDTMTISTDCFDAPIALFGTGGAAIITSTDYDFGKVLVGGTKCGGKVTIRNTGTLPFLLTSKWVFTNIIGDSAFSMEAPSAARLQPAYTLWPANDPDHPRHDTINLYFCYTPTELGFNAATVVWNTNIQPPFNTQGKPTSYLSGKGVNSGVIWDVPTDTLFADSNTTPPIVVTDRVELIQQSTTKIRVDKVIITGPDAAEFMIVGNQLGITPLEGFDMNPGDSIWVDISFNPDLTKPYPQKFADRHANLDAIFFTDAAHTLRETSTIKLTGTFTGKLSVAEQHSNTDLRAYYSNHQLIIELPKNSMPPYEFSLYDILGRKIKSWKGSEMNISESNILLPVETLTSGTYIVRFKSNADVRSCSIIVQ
ncbi:MAG TPA: hypothetical protein VFO76_02775, partial [Candidatus Kapabacteria bacterium]|nr:hypothetical protein [Candidatus Kapabacteria bacterium]